MLYLAPSPVVARVATLTAEIRHNPADYLRREREVTTAVGRLGLDVVAPTDLVDLGPHEIDGLWFLLMLYRRLEPVDLGSAEHAAAVGRSLAELLAALAELPPTLSDTGQGQPWDEITTLLATVRPTTDAAVMTSLTDARPSPCPWG